jgi:hypothetical protein
MNALMCRWCWHLASSHTLLTRASATLLLCGDCPGWPACAWRLQRIGVAA